MIKEYLGSTLLFEFDLDMEKSPEDCFMDCINQVQNEIALGSNLELEISHYQKISVQHFLNRKHRFTYNSIISGICYMDDNNCLIKFRQDDFFYNIQSNGYMNFSNGPIIKSSKIDTEYTLHNQKIIVFPSSIDVEIKMDSNSSGYFLIFNSFFKAMPKII